jgi:hypothetical protein
VVLSPFGVFFGHIEFGRFVEVEQFVGLIISVVLFYLTVILIEDLVNFAYDILQREMFGLEVLHHGISCAAVAIEYGHVKEDIFACAIICFFLW